MANIRGFRDLNNNNNNYQQMQEGGQGGQFNIPFLSGPPSNPKDENFGTMLTNTLCPRLRLFSFTSFLVIFITVLYFTMLGVGGIDKRGFLLVERQTLKDFGGNDPYDVKYNGSLYLLFTSLFLAQDFLSWIMSCIYIMIFCSSLEQTIGLRNTIIIFLCGGASGALFGCVCTCCNITSVYSETYSGQYALVGSFLAIVILYWSKLEVLGPMRMMLGCLIFIMVLFMFMFAFGGNYLYTDNLGGLGGFLGGMFIGMCIVDVPQPENYEKGVRKFGLGFLALYLGLCIILLYSLTYQT